MKLLNKTKLNDEALLKQYELYVSGSEKVSERRMTANAFMWTIQGGLLTLIGVGFGTSNQALLFLAPLFGIASSYVWTKIVNSYKQLNSGKFKVLHEIEKELPANLYAYEWELLGKGKDSSLYEPTSHIENNLPKICMYFWILALAIFLFGLLVSNISIEVIISCL